MMIVKSPPFFLPLFTSHRQLTDKSTKEHKYPSEHGRRVTGNINVLTKFYMLSKGLTMSTRKQYFKLRGGI